MSDNPATVKLTETYPAWQYTGANTPPPGWSITFVRYGAYVYIAYGELLLHINPGNYVIDVDGQYLVMAPDDVEVVE